MNNLPKTKNTAEGICSHCGKQLDFYDSKWICQITNKIYCAFITNSNCGFISKDQCLELPFWVYYTDG